MMDFRLTEIAEWIYYDLIPGLGRFFENIFSDSIFASMTIEEIQIGCIKIALEALALAVLVKIGTGIARKMHRKKTVVAGKGFKPRKWSPTGWYWDEDKGVWVPPDFVSEESKRRWTWDEKKRIWIDNDAPKSNGGSSK